MNHRGEAKSSQYSSQVQLSQKFHGPVVLPPQDSHVVLSALRAQGRALAPGLAELATLTANRIARTRLSLAQIRQIYADRC